MDGGRRPLYGNNYNHPLHKLVQPQNINEVYADHFIRPETIIDDDDDNNNYYYRHHQPKIIKNPNPYVDNSIDNIYYRSDDDQMAAAAEAANDENNFYMIQDYDNDDDDNNFYNRWDQTKDDQCLMRIKDFLNEMGVTI